MRTLLLVTALALAARGTARAQDAPTGSLGVALTGSNEGAGLSLDGRLTLRRGTTLGLGIAAAWRDVAYFGGRSAHGVATVEPSLLVLLPAARTGTLALDVRLGTGMRFARDVGDVTTQHERATRVVTELGLFGHLRVGPTLVLRAGALLVIEVEAAPTVALADMMQLVSLGVGIQVAPNALLYATAEAGGTYGFDGNNGKVVARGALGVRVPFGGDPRAPF